MAKDDYDEPEIADAADDDEDLEIDDDLEIDVLGADDVDDSDVDDADTDEELEDDLDEDESDDQATDEEEESLDVLLAREQGDDDDPLRLDEEPRDGLTTTTTPIGADEFTCRSCFLVKRRAQLADEKKLICLDCA